MILVALLISFAQASTPTEMAAPEYWEVAYGSGKKQKQIQARSSLTQAEARSFQKLVLKKEGEVSRELFSLILESLQKMARAEAEKKPQDAPSAKTKKVASCPNPLVAKGSQGTENFIFKTCVSKKGAVGELLAALTKLEDALPALKPSKK